MGIEDDDLIEGSPPSAPQGLEVSGTEATTATLKWKEPRKDGGAPIKEYFIEFKSDQDEEWQEGPKIKPKKFLTETVAELTPKMKYQFRVSAYNRAGWGEPSDSTDPKLLKASKAPPTIDRTGFPEGIVNVKVNSQLVLEVPIEAVPPPVTSWYQNDKELLTRDGLKVVHNPCMAKLMFIPALRPLSGKYLLKAKNQWGEDSAEIQVNVVGKPDMPGGPLKVMEVTKKSCRLEWKPPADNGGYQITHYEVEKLDNTNGSWLPVKSVKAMSLEVTNLVEGRAYKFLVRAVNQIGDSPDLETEKEVIAKNPFDPPSAVGKPTVPDWGEDFAEVAWKPSEDDGGADISGYRVEVRNRDRRAWNVAGTAGGSESSFRVEKHMSVDNDYEFRVIALNKGGESEASPVSNTIHAMIRFIKPKINRDVFPTEKTIHASQTLKIETEVVAEPQPTVIWTFPNGKSVTEDSRCSIEFDKNEGVATLSIKDIKRSDAGNYKIMVKNSVGLDEMEMRLDVLSAPSIPKGFLEISNVCPTGCKLTWNMPEDNGGSPILGYNIEKKDVERDAWVACGKVASKMMAVMKQIEFDVTGLIPYFVYMFRVTPFNAQGEGEVPLESKVPMMSKEALDPPEPPANPRVVNYDKTYVELQWWAPDKSDIKHYIIEMQETFLVPKDAAMPEEAEGEEQQPQASETEKAMAPTNKALADAMARAAQPAAPGFTGEFEEYCSPWMTVMITDDNTPEVKIKDLSEGHSYSFRTKAVNGAGPSWPSLPTEELVCKIKKLRPMIDKSSLQPIRVSKGQNITLSAKVQGEPVPFKAWFYGRIEIKACPSVEMIEKENSIKLVMMGARRDDTGIYTLKADNDHGQDQADVEVVVMVEPSKPRGPMKMNDITADGCLAEWSAPEDDGGTPITQYIIEKAEGASVNWTVCGSTKGDVTKCRVTGLKTGKDHRLQVFAVNAEGTSEPLECVDAFIPENPFGTPGAPGKPEQIGGDFDNFEVKYEEPRNNGGSKVTSYELQARLWRANDWFECGSDKLCMNRLEARGQFEVGQHYAIRVRALNAAGAGPWSLESDQLNCKYSRLRPKVSFKDVATKEVVTFKAGESMAFEVDIQGEPPAHDIIWSLAGKELTDGGVGVKIDNSKPYKSFISVDGLTRKDIGPLDCTATNMEGKSSCAIEINVVDKPSMPEDRLMVSNVSKTGCRVSWQAPKDNGGLPIEYIIEKFTAQSDSWAIHGVTTGTAYDFSDLEAGQEYGFAVKSSNAVGDSDALPTAKLIMAKDQFTIPLPPGAPDVVDWSERHMDLKWQEPLDDGGAAVTSYHIEAKIRGEEEDWQLWETVDTNRTKATNLSVQRGKAYQFRVIAINKAGKSDPSHPSRSKEAQPTSLPPLIDAKNLHDVVVVAGDRVKFDLPFQGIPVPEVVWTLNGNEEEPLATTSDKNMIITVNETSTKLIINNVTKKHAGKFQCTVTNSAGSDSAKGEIKVLDRPEPPEGLTASVDGDKCVLMWKRSKDDGGAPIEHYQVERFELDRGCWMACGKSHGNTFDAKGLLSGREYKFRVSAVNEHGDSDPAVAKETIIMSQQDLDNAVRNM